MIVLVCGGRSYFNEKNIWMVMDLVLRDKGPFTLLHGGAPGADRVAKKWALLRELKVIDFPANWERHGKAAGPLRNQQMLGAYKVDLVVGFPGGKGTADMLTRAEQKGIEIIIAAGAI